MKQELNILIADDHIDVRNGIRHMLQNQHVYNFNFFELYKYKVLLQLMMKKTLKIIHFKQ